MSPAAEHHQLQDRPNYCVPACACIVLSSAGKHVPSQATIAGDWTGSGRGFDLGEAAKVVEAERMQWDLTDPKLPSVLRWLLATGHWVIAQVFSKGLQEHYDASPPPVLGPFGDLDREWGRLHAIVLVGATSHAFEYLDPFHCAKGQPFHIDTDTLFGSVMQAAVCVCPIQDSVEARSAESED